MRLVLHQINLAISLKYKPPSFFRNCRINWFTLQNELCIYSKTARPTIFWRVNFVGFGTMFEVSRPLLWRDKHQKLLHWIQCIIVVLKKAFPFHLEIHFIFQNILTLKQPSEMLPLVITIFQSMSNNFNILQCPHPRQNSIT